MAWDPEKGAEAGVDQKVAVRFFNRKRSEHPVVKRVGADHRKGDDRHDHQQAQPLFFKTADAIGIAETERQPRCRDHYDEKVFYFVADYFGLRIPEADLEEGHESPQRNGCHEYGK